MVNIDFWYNNKIEDVTSIDVFFNGFSGKYQGNMYINKKKIGDFTCTDSLELENTFKQLEFNWD